MRVRNFRNLEKGVQICDNWTLVAWVDRVSGVTWVLALKCVMPLSRNLPTSRNGDNGLGDRTVVRVDPAITDDVVRCDVLDRLSK